jgi:hypothetical protein
MLTSYWPVRIRISPRPQEFRGENALVSKLPLRQRRLTLGARVEGPGKAVFIPRGLKAGYIKHRHPSGQIYGRPSAAQCCGPSAHHDFRSPDQGLRLRLRPWLPMFCAFGAEKLASKTSHKLLVLSRIPPPLWRTSLDFYNWLYKSPYRWLLQVPMLSLDSGSSPHHNQSHIRHTISENPGCSESACCKVCTIRPHIQGADFGRFEPTERSDAWVP